MAYLIVRVSDPDRVTLIRENESVECTQIAIANTAYDAAVEMLRRLSPAQIHHLEINDLRRIKGQVAGVAPPSGNGSVGTNAVNGVN